MADISLISQYGDGLMITYSDGSVMYAQQQITGNGYHQVMMMVLIPCRVARVAVNRLMVSVTLRLG